MMTSSSSFLLLDDGLDDNLLESLANFDQDPSHCYDEGNFFDWVAVDGLPAETTEIQSYDSAMAIESDAQTSFCDESRSNTSDDISNYENVGDVSFFVSAGESEDLTLCGKRKISSHAVVKNNATGIKSGGIAHRCRFEGSSSSYSRDNNSSNGHSKKLLSTCDEEEPLAKYPRGRNNRGIRSFDQITRSLEHLPAFERCLRGLFDAYNHGNSKRVPMLYYHLLHSDCSARTWFPVTYNRAGSLSLWQFNDALAATYPDGVWRIEKLVNYRTDYCWKVRVTFSFDGTRVHTKHMDDFFGNMPARPVADYIDGERVEPEKREYLRRLEEQSYAAKAPIHVNLRCDVTFHLHPETGRASEYFFKGYVFAIKPSRDIFLISVPMYSSCSSNSLTH